MEEQKTCAELIGNRLASRLNDLDEMVPLLRAEDIQIEITNPFKITAHVRMLEERYSYDVYGDFSGGHSAREFIAMEICDDVADMHRDNQLDDFHSYGLCADAKTDDHGAYIEWQLSWGGPSDGFRFYITPDGQPHRITYFFHDWFDGAERVLSGDDLELLRDAFVMMFGDDSYAAEFWGDQMEGRRNG